MLAHSFSDYVGGHGLSGRVGFVGGDFFTDPLPSGDVLIMGRVARGQHPRTNLERGWAISSMIRRGRIGDVDKCGWYRQTRRNYCEDTAFAARVVRLLIESF